MKDNKIDKVELWASLISILLIVLFLAYYFTDRESATISAITFLAITLGFVKFLLNHIFEIIIIVILGYVYYAMYAIVLVLRSIDSEIKEIREEKIKDKIFIK